MSNWQQVTAEIPKKKYKYGEEYEDRREERRIWLSTGGYMLIDYIAPEDDNPWNNDNDPLGPQAA